MKDINKKSRTVSEALDTRLTCRAFKSTAIKKEVIFNILDIFFGQCAETSQISEYRSIGASFDAAHRAMLDFLFGNSLWILSTSLPLLFPIFRRNPILP